MVAVRTKRRFNVDEYHIISEAGALRADEHTELIDGEIIVMAAIGRDHAFLVHLLSQRLYDEVQKRVVVWSQNPIRLNPFWEPQPDIALLKPPDETYRRRIPITEDILLVIEVSDSTLGDDLYIKLPQYAASGIPEAWVVDVQAARVGVFRGPSAAGYLHETWLGREGMLIPLALPNIRITITDLFGIA